MNDQIVDAADALQTGQTTPTISNICPEKENGDGR
jgi:hypothetical protein